jgi:hypothetical protein
MRSPVEFIFEEACEYVGMETRLTILQKPLLERRKGLLRWLRIDGHECRYNEQHNYKKAAHKFIRSACKIRPDKSMTRNSAEMNMTS